MSKLRQTMAGTALAMFAAGTALPVIAHPMGNFSINHYAGIAPDSKGVSVLYVIDMAEIPTVSERSEIDAAGTPQSYLAKKAGSMAGGLQLKVDGKSLPLSVVTKEMAFHAGAGGLQTLRMAFRLRASAPLGAASHTVDYQDGNYTERAGWKEIVMQPAGGLGVQGTGFSETDRSAALSRYPNLLTTAPPQDMEAHIALSSAGAAAPAAIAAAPAAASASGISTPHDAFTEAIARRQLTPAVMLLGLLMAFMFGAFHALSPGHGKAMVAAYLVGSRGTVKHAVALGAIVTVTHTLGVFALGFVTLFASKYIVPEKLYPVLSAISGLAVFGVGAWLLYARIRVRGGDGHTHDHDHEHSHDHEHTHDHEHLHDHGHTHDHEHLHDHGHTHDHEHLHDHARGHGHSHGFGRHHHHVPEGPVTAKSLLALGISGGIVPCPSALVVLLSAVALHRIVYGMFLISAFSLGLAAVLIAIGVLVVSAAHWFDRVPTSAKAMQALPVFSAAAITCIGVVLVVRAFGQGV